jgi:hypothetical protein
LPKERLRLGRFDIPLVRLPNAISDAEKVYKYTSGNVDFHINDIATAWNLVGPSSGGFYKRLNSMVLFGLVETVSKARFKIAELTKNILYGEDAIRKNRAITDAFFHVELWSKLYDKVKRDPPPSIFSQLSNITGAEPLEIKNTESDIKSWYLEDISIVPEGILQQREQKSYSYGESSNRIDLSQEYVTEPETEAFGTVIVNGVGTVRVKDEDSLAAAEAFLNIIRKRVDDAKKGKEPINASTTKALSLPEGNPYVEQ